MCIHYDTIVDLTINSRDTKLVIDNDDRKIIADWMETGKLLACDELFYKASQLYYLDISMGLPAKRNSNLIKFPDSCLNGFEFEEVLIGLGIEKISWDDIQRDLPTDASDEILPNLIKERSIFLGIFLNGSCHPEFEEKIKSRVGKIQFYNPSKIIITCDYINYKESNPNYYDEESNSIYYVRTWNSIKNINLGDYLIDALVLDKSKISTQVLLRFLDDDIEDVKDYLLDNGCNLEDIPDEYDNKLLNEDEDYNVNTLNIEAEAIHNDIYNIVSSLCGVPVIPS